MKSIIFTVRLGLAVIGICAVSTGCQQSSTPVTSSVISQAEGNSTTSSTRFMPSSADRAIYSAVMDSMDPSKTNPERAAILSVAASKGLPCLTVEAAYASVIYKKPFTATGHDQSFDLYCRKGSSPPSLWQYGENVDSFSKQKTQYATLTSSNTIQFGFPYEGEQHATLLYGADRSSGKFGSYLTLSVERGQFYCNGDETFCTVQVKFDNGTPINWVGNNHMQDGRTNELVFTDNPHDMSDACFYLLLTRTKKLTVRATFFQQGDRDFTFDVVGLKSLPLPKPDNTEIRHCRLPKTI